MEQNTVETLETKASSVSLRTNIQTESIFVPVYKMPGRLNLAQKRSRQSEYAEEACKLQRTSNKPNSSLQHPSSSHASKPKPNIQNVQQRDGFSVPSATKSDAQSQYGEDIHSPSVSQSAIHAESLAIQISRTSWTKVQNQNLSENSGTAAVQRMAAGDWMNANFNNHTSTGNIPEIKKPRRCRKRKKHTLTTLGWMIDDADPAKRTRSGSVYGYRL